MKVYSWGHGRSNILIMVRWKRSMVDPVSSKETLEIGNDVRGGGLLSYFDFIYLLPVMYSTTIIKMKMLYTNVMIDSPTERLTLKVVSKM